MVPLIIESWIWWSVVIIVAFSRFLSRRMTLGSFKKFQADDYLMMLALCFYTSLISTINIVRHTSSNLLPPNFDVNSLTKQDIREREYGSKLILVVEQSQCATIWLTKGCLCLLYLRITNVHRENIAIKILTGYVIVTFVVMDSLYFGVWCQPFHEYWAVPTDSTQCDAATNHLITNACFNLSSDIAMLVIVLPIFLRMKLPWRKKWPLIILFSLGVFTIVAAVLNKVYSFSEPFGSLWTFWYTRESSTALLVANLPFVWTLWLRIPGVRWLMGRTQLGQAAYGLGSSPANPASVKGGEGARGIELSLSRSSEEELEMPRQRRVTFTDMLEERNPASMTGQPTPLTHPQLFYSRKTSDDTDLEDLDSESLADVIAEEKGGGQGSSSPQDRPASAVESTNHPSMNSRKSVETLV